MLMRAALDAARIGFPVFPLRPGDKRPAFPNHPADDCDLTDPRCRAAEQHVGWEPRATTDPHRIGRAWSAGPYNVGIACGPARLVVVDLDVPKPDQTRPAEWRIDGVRDGSDVFAVLCERAGQPWPVTYTVRTGRGGWHVYFHHPAGPALRNTTGALGWLVDTRAAGGYVVGAGSVVAGRPYTVEADAEVAPLPAWLAQSLTPQPERAAGPVAVILPPDRRGGYLGAALDRSARAVRESGAERHNAALFGAACSLGELVAGGELTDDQVLAVLLPAALDVGQPRGEALRTIRSGLRHGARRPRSVAA